MNDADNDLNWPLQDTLQAWRHDFHRHPETAFQEHRTSARVAELLKSWGVPVEERLITAEELFDAAEAGRLEEAFGSGTAHPAARHCCRWATSAR